MTNIILDYLMSYEVILDLGVERSLVKSDHIQYRSQ